MKFFIFLLLPVFVNAQSKYLKYSWRKISGPAQYNIVSPNAASTAVTNLTAGVYRFELKVTNNKGLFSRDTMSVTVKKPDEYSYRKKGNSVSLASN